MAVNTLNEVKINKISSTQFETEKTAGNITSTMETNEVFIFTDDKVFTQAEKTKLAGVESGANNYTLPTDVVQDSNYVHTDNNYSSTDKAKLTNIEAGAEANVIEIVKLNGTALTPDSNKAVDIVISAGNTAITKLWS